MALFEKFTNIVQAAQSGSGGQQGLAQDISNIIAGNSGIYQETADYHVTTFYENRLNVGGRGGGTIPPLDVRRALSRMASSLSGVPTHPFQGADYGQGGRAYHVVTPKVPGMGTAVHSLNTFIFNEIANHDDLKPAAGGDANNLVKNMMLGKGFLENVTNINYAWKAQSNTEMSALDKKMMYFSQFTGMTDVYGGTQGFDFWYPRNDPGSYQESNLNRRFGQVIPKLQNLFGIRQSDTTIRDRAFRMRESVMTMYNSIHTDPGVMPVSHAGQINSFGTIPDQILTGLEAVGYSSLNSVVQNTLQYGSYDNLSGNDFNRPPTTTQAPPVPTTPPPTPTASQQAYQDTEPDTDDLGTGFDQDGPDPDSTSPPNTVRVEGDRPAFDQNYTQSDVMDAYNATTPSIQQPGQLVAIDSDASIVTISENQFKQLEREFATGGIETQTEGHKIATTERSISALQELRTLLDTPERNGTSFYDKGHSNYLPKTAFDTIDVDPLTMDNDTKKKLSLGGALVGVNPNGTQTWMVDNHTKTQDYAGEGRQDLDAHDPNINFDHESWEIVNSDMQVRDALGKGYLIPIKGNKVIFAPSFTALDFTYGMEFEVGNLSESMTELKRQAKNVFGYDLDRMGFSGRWEAKNDPSIPSEAYGMEYVTPIMAGTRALKASYVFGETLKLAGAKTATHRGSRNDPIGIHVNMGVLHESSRKQSVKFLADYMRLTEDVFKKITTGDKRYRYRTTGDYFTYNNAAQPQTFPGDTNINRDEFRQFWNQSISDLREVGGGMSEYEYLRENGEFWNSVSPHANSDSDRLSKYKTIALHKILLDGVMELRSPMYQPGGDIAVNHLIMASKLGGDIYQGTMTGTQLPVTDKLVPPVNGWGVRSQDMFNEILKTVFGITNPADAKLVFDMHQQCQDG